MAAVCVAWSLVGGSTPAHAAEEGATAPAAAATPTPVSTGDAKPAAAKPVAAPAVEKPEWATGPWHVVAARDGGKARIMTANGRPVSVAEGLGDVGWGDRLLDRAAAAERLDSGIRPYWVERGVVFAVAALLGVAGIIGAGTGLGLVLMYRIDLVPPAALRPFAELPRIGPAILLVGVLALVVSAVAFTVGGAFTAFLVLRPPPPAERIVDAMGAAVLWDPAEAAEVTARHNAQPHVAGAVPEGAPAVTPPPESKP